MVDFPQATPPVTRAEPPNDLVLKVGMAGHYTLDDRPVTLAELRARVDAIAKVLLDKNPVTMKAAKDTFKRVRNMPWDASDDYIYAKLEQMLLLDKTNGREQGLKQFLDDKT